ncbi:bifunctional folylpolyglutamate synthase/dihydrofolate synthase [Pullulanibacillus camelliae]|uniref:tetrahydrofolate synthase n=1 Tax=Pullulanibacillus camelliae TaxID=1707096 RepID=A0A8J3DX51_9BACL|nr:Mur ligase family protein [Pullulanibacillus camelliae]GGE44968.1 bifunctional folylpolyglutamate synthase/dihydrofolate synthase [Pullulanibacillus camelliae]
MNHQECLQYLEAFYTRKTPRDGRHLLVMERLLRRFAIYHHHFIFVQIAGSCGKGSTAAFISSMLTQAGLKHGLFTGPHLADYEERFAITGHNISRQEFIQVVDRIKRTLTQDDLQAVGHMHMMILIALLWFKEKGIKLVVFENGVGGAADPSNLFNPLVACLTEITLDHMHLLGDTIEAITIDKAAIVKPQTQAVICGMRHPIAREIMGKLERELEKSFTFFERDYDYQASEGAMNFKSKTIEAKQLMPSLPGQHQYQNASNAISVIEALRALGYNIPNSAMRCGVAQAKWPGRLERLSFGNGAVILDGAHNPFELATLHDSLICLNCEPSIIVISFASRKNSLEMLKALHFPQALYLVAPSPFLERRQSQQVVEAAFQQLGLNYKYDASLGKLLEWARASLKASEVLLVTGSLYLVGAVREQLIR